MRVDDAERTRRLQAVVAECVKYGSRVESETPFQAVLVDGRPINHVAHLLGVALSCGVWLIGYVAVLMFDKGEQRRVVCVDQYGVVR